MGKPEGVFLRSEILRTLVQADPEGGESIPALVSALRDEDSSVVQAAIESLCLLGPRAKDAASPLAALIMHNVTDPKPKDYGEHRAIRALHRIDTTGNFAIPALIAVLNHRDDKRENEVQGGPGPRRRRPRRNRRAPPGILRCQGQGGHSRVDRCSEDPRAG